MILWPVLYLSSLIVELWVAWYDTLTRLSLSSLIIVGIRGCIVISTILWPVLDSVFSPLLEWGRMHDTSTLLVLLFTFLKGNDIDILVILHTGSDSTKLILKLGIILVIFPTGSDLTISISIWELLLVILHTWSDSTRHSMMGVISLIYLKFGGSYLH